MLEAFGGRQRDLLTLLLNNKKGLTIDRMAAALNITRNAVREHVSALERDRLVAPAAFTVTGGRPGRVYALTDRGLALFPKHYDLMARMLLESLVTKLGGPGAEEELTKLGERIAAQLKARIPPGSPAAKASSVAITSLGLARAVRRPSPSGPRPAVQAVVAKMSAAAMKRCIGLP